jgi:3-oxoacyl-(acyl-carrier-protein) synthase/acyl carrier protein
MPTITDLLSRDCNEDEDDFFADFDDTNTTTSSSSPYDSKIAITGVGIRFPGCEDDLELFWDNLINRKNFSVPIHGRYHFDERFDEKIIYNTNGHLLENIDMFDNKFFGISHIEAVEMDPQHKIALETAYLTLHNAGYEKGSLEGNNIGVWVGQCSSDWANFITKSEFNAYTSTSCSYSITSNHISYCLGLVGPSMTVDTACSSSLVSVSLGVQSLRNKECDAALVGGVTLLLAGEAYAATCAAKMLSVDGRCRSFDAGANGYARGEGCGFVLCKRLEDAQKDCDTIYATIEGIGANQDGKSAVLTAPNGPAQENIYEKVLHQAGLEPSDIGFIATHGTGTSLGDPIEARGIAEVYGGVGRTKNNPLYFGAVKANIGHTEGAAGIANLIYGLLVLKKQVIPPIYGLEEINPFVKEAIQDKGIVIPQSLVKPSKAIEYVAASSFGFGGTNCHLIMKRYGGGGGNLPMKQTRLNDLGFTNRKRIPIFPDPETNNNDDDRTIHYKLNTFSQNIISSSTPSTTSETLSYCVVSTSMSEYQSQVDNIILHTQSKYGNVCNYDDLCTRLLKAILPQQKLYIFNDRGMVNGCKGLMFAYSHDNPNGFGSYIEYENPDSVFPLDELRATKNDFWVRYDKKSQRSIVAIEPVVLENPKSKNITTSYASETDIGLVTGGTGCVGRAVINELYRKGMRKFVIVTRSSKLSSEDLHKLPLAQITYEHIDLCSNEDVKRLFFMHNITGVYHCAGGASYDTHDQVDLHTYAPKTLGAQLLHQYSNKQTTKDFWLTSSVSSVWGTGKNYGYCYANAFLDSLAFKRRSASLPVTIRMMGPIFGSDMIADFGDTFGKIGLETLPVEEMVKSFTIGGGTEDTNDVDNNNNEIIVCGIMNHFGKTLKTHDSLFSQIRTTQKKMVETRYPTRPTFTTREEIETEICRILALLTGEKEIVELEESFADFYGFDSLLSVELVNEFQNSFGELGVVDSTVVLDYPNIKTLTNYLYDQSTATLANDYVVVDSDECITIYNKGVGHVVFRKENHLRKNDIDHRSVYFSESNISVSDDLINYHHEIFIFCSLLPHHQFQFDKELYDIKERTNQIIRLERNPKKKILHNFSLLNENHHAAVNENVGGGGGGVPIWFIHPIEGTIEMYQDILYTKGPLYGIYQSNIKRNFLKDAKEYTELIQHHQPEGPYVVGGFSYGGRVAWEVCRQLQTNGEVVKNLILFDIGPNVLNLNWEDDDFDTQVFVNINQFFTDYDQDSVEYDYISDEQRNSMSREDVMGSMLEMAKNLSSRIDPYSYTQYEPLPGKTNILCFKTENRSFDKNKLGDCNYVEINPKLPQTTHFTLMYDPNVRLFDFNMI